MLSFMRRIADLKRETPSLSNSLLVGIGRLFDFRGSYNRAILLDRLSKDGFEQDRSNLQGDYFMICQDMRNAESKLRRVYGKTQKKLQHSKA